MSRSSYGANPATSNIDYVRFLIGDTDPDDFLLVNSEISGLLSLYGGPVAASIVACESLAAKFSRLCDEEVGDVRVDLSQKAANFLKLAVRLRQQQAIGSPIPFAGGILVDDKQSNAGDITLVKPRFTKRMHDSPKINDLPQNEDEFE